MGDQTKVQKSRQQTHRSRSLGIALTPKAKKYFDKRPYPPGERGRLARRSNSDYAIRLREKQRLRAQYALKEKQLHAIYDRATKYPETGDAMIEMLERRLDVLVLRAGFARTILQARQAVTHHHVLLDGELVDRPSIQVKVGQTFQIKPKSQGMTPFRAAAQGINKRVLPPTPEYIDVQLDKLSAKLVAVPEREKSPAVVDIQMVVEYYAR